MRRVLTVVLALFILSFIPLTAQTSVALTSRIPDSAKLRSKYIETWFAGSIATVKQKMPEIGQNELGQVFQIRSEPFGEDKLAIVIAPQKIIPVDVYTDSGIEVGYSPVYPSETPGCWVLIRSLETGETLAVRYYFAQDSDVYVQFNNDKPKVTVDFVIFGAYTAKGTPVGFSLETLYTSSFSDIQSWTALSLPWNNVVIYDGMYSSTKEMIHDIRDNLGRVILTDDAVYDYDNSPICISDGSPLYVMNDNDQRVKADVLRERTKETDPVQDIYLSNAGFIKWIVDGIVRILSGSPLKVQPLLKQTVEYSQGSLSDILSTRNNISFSLDWTRNLAAGAVSVSSGTNYFFDTSGADVKIEPFAALTNNENYKQTLGYIENCGYTMEVLKPLLYVLATTEPGRFYLGALREYDVKGVPSGKNKESKEFHFFRKAVALFPYFDSEGYFHVTVFMEGKEIPLETFINQNKKSFIHLVRIKASERYALQ